MSAFALYHDGRGGDAFAEVAGTSLAACFAEMADAVADWLPGALAGEAGREAPRAIELTLEWDGAAAPEPAPRPPGSPGDATRRDPPRPRRSVLCVARRRPRRPLAPATPAPVALRGRPA
ncbi:MAG TPA: hypothetical protein VHA80_05550 [Solirubrobacterales bacterium]|nr:hypothetical protein [Solirubrobacterales bacterium]